MGHFEKYRTCQSAGKWNTKAGQTILPYCSYTREERRKVKPASKTNNNNSIATTQQLHRNKKKTAIVFRPLEQVVRDKGPMYAFHRILLAQTYVGHNRCRCVWPWLLPTGRELDGNMDLQEPWS